jgi:hypothetical protein
MKHLQGFYDKINEAKVAIQDTTNIKFNVGSLIQIVSENDKNIGQATFKKALKTIYHVQYKGKLMKVDKKNLSINKHGQVQTELKNLK